MNKKIIALILLLPMILMMTLYTAVNTVSLQVKVPVSKIEILSEEFVSLDLDKGERFFVDYAVYPTTASNKEVNFSTENIGAQPKAELEYSNGYIVPKSAGMAYACFTTVDGSLGVKGFAVDGLKGLDYSYFYTCGPELMLKSVYNNTTTSGELSFEERMGCGFGGCMGCSCKTITGYKRICKEGPVLKKEEILWKD